MLCGHKKKHRVTIPCKWSFENRTLFMKSVRFLCGFHAVFVWFSCSFHGLFMHFSLFICFSWAFHFSGAFTFEVCFSCAFHFSDAFHFSFAFHGLFTFQVLLLLRCAFHVLFTFQVLFIDAPYTHTCTICTYMHHQMCA